MRSIHVSSIVFLFAISFCASKSVGQSDTPNSGTRSSEEAQPEDSGKPFTDPKLLAELEAIDAKAESVVDLRASFEQTKKTPLLRKPLVSSGTVLVKGRAVRWDTQRPHPSVLHVSDESIRVYYPEQKVVEVYPVDEDMRRLTASPLPRLSLIREQFSIRQTEASKLDAKATAETHLAILLTPKQENLRTHVREVRVLIHRERAIAERVELTGSEGETTSIRFDDVELNSNVADDALRLKLPENVRVSYPLGRPPPKESR